jgi:regulatory protein
MNLSPTHDRTRPDVQLGEATRVRSGMRITALNFHPREPHRVDVCIDGEHRLTLATEVATAVPLRVGDRISHELLGELEARDQRWRAREAALILLSFRARSRAELKRRLMEKGFREEIAQGCVNELSRGGLVDDSSFAESFVRDRLRFRPRGTQLLLQELSTRGVDADIARATLNEVLEREEMSETDLARQAAAKWSPKPAETRLRARRRLYNFLARRGFGMEAVRDVVDELLP